MISVRPADLSDTDWILSQMREFYEFIGVVKGKFPSEDRARDLVHNFIEKHIAFISEYQASVFPIRTGFTIALLQPHPWLENAAGAPLIVVTELFWWVATQYRGTRSGALLLQELERVAHEQADWHIMALERGSPVKPETLERRGFFHIESSFLREL